VILVDTSVIGAWVDPDYDQHEAWVEALVSADERETRAASSVTYGELAAGARNREGVDETLRGFVRLDLDLDFDAAWRASLAFRRLQSGRAGEPGIPDFLIRLQAAVLNLPHLTSDHRRLSSSPEVDFIFWGKKPA